jgi:RNA polymerase sigma-70 factor (ECF subfamily)
VVEGYMEAMERGDVEAVVGLLAEDAAWSMPPLAAWFTGTEGLREFMKAGPLSGEWRWRHIPTQANGQPAVASYAWYDEDQAYRLFSIDVITLEGPKIKSITSFITRSVLSRDEDFYQRYPEQPMDESNLSVDPERFGLPELLDR